MATQQRCTTGCRTSQRSIQTTTRNPSRGCAGAPRALAHADAVIFSTPEYAGTLPGSLKNLLDWTVGGGEIYGKPAAWINVAPPGRGDGADAALRVVLGYVGATVLDSSGPRVPVSHESVCPDGLIGDPATRAALGKALANILAELETLPSEEPDG